MADSPEPWVGDEWERHATKLLHLRHPNGALQETPSQYRGDLGIDGFVRTEGLAYQCYAAQEPLTHKQLHDKQKQKITDDTQKLIDRQADVGQLLGTCVLKRWTLVVPRFTSTPLLGHCETRAAALRGAGISFIDASFKIYIAQRASFRTEEDRLLGSVARVPIPDLPADETGVDRLADDKPEFLQNIEEKLANQLITADPKETVRSLLYQYLEGKNIEDHLRSSVPPLFEAVQDVRRRRERALNGLGSLVNAKHADRLQTVRHTIASDLQENLGSLTSNVRDALCDAMVIDWLGRCPLRLL